MYIVWSYMLNKLIVAFQFIERRSRKCSTRLNKLSHYMMLDVVYIAEVQRYNDIYSPYISHSYKLKRAVALIFIYNWCHCEIWQLKHAARFISFSYSHEYLSADSFCSRYMYMCTAWCQWCLVVEKNVWAQDLIYDEKTQPSGWDYRVGADDVRYTYFCRT